RLEERDGGADAFFARTRRVDTRSRRTVHHVHEAFDEPFGLAFGVRVFAGVGRRALASVEAERRAHGFDDAHARVARGCEALDTADRAQRFGDRSEHVGVAVRHRLPDQHARVELFARDVCELVGDAALADAGIAVEEDELRA